MDAMETTPLIGENTKDNHVRRANEVENGEPSNSDIAQPTAGKPLAKLSIWVIPALVIGVFMAAIDGLVVNAIYGRLGTEFQNLDLAPWTSTAFFLAQASTQPLYGKLSDIFGRKACMIFCFSWFGLGSLLCGLAQSMEQFIGARILQGLGGGGIITLVTIYISDVIPSSDRGLWQGYMNVVNAVGQGLGTIIGGMMADTIGWRWIFLIQAILSAVGLLPIIFCMTERREVSNIRAHLRRVDLIGSVLLVLSIFTLLFGLDAGGRQEFSKPIAYVPLICCPILVALFVLVEGRIAAEPVAPPHIFLNREVISVYVQNLCLLGGINSLLFYLPLFFQAVLRANASKTGFLLLPAIACSTVGAVSGGILLRKTTAFRLILGISNLMMTLGMVVVVLSLTFTELGLVGVEIGSAITAICAGSCVVTTLMALMSAVSEDDQAVAIACMYLFRSIGSATGISLSGTVVQKVLGQELSSALRGNSAAKTIAEGIHRSLKYIDTLAPELQQVARLAYEKAVRAGMAFDTGVFAITIFAAPFVAGRKRAAQ